MDLGHGHATHGLHGLPEPRSLSPVTRVNDICPATSRGRVITLSPRPLGGPLCSQPPSPGAHPSRCPTEQMTGLLSSSQTQLLSHCVTFNKTLTLSGLSLFP